MHHFRIFNQKRFIVLTAALIAEPCQGLEGSQLDPVEAEGVVASVAEGSAYWGAGVGEAVEVVGQGRGDGVAQVRPGAGVEAGGVTLHESVT